MATDFIMKERAAVWEVRVRLVPLLVIPRRTPARAQATPQAGGCSDSPLPEHSDPRPSLPPQLS